MSQYYVITPDGKRFGPTDFQTLCQWAGEGRITPGMMVEDTLSRQTMTASSVPGLFPPGAQPQYAPYMRPTPPPGAAQASGQATAALVLGIVSMFAWCIPIIGLPITITAVVFGIKNLNSLDRTKALIGLILGSIGLLLTIANFVLGVWIARNGLNF
ncbi:MAG TPA: hypothetical protein VHE55_00250 [Fimbriimonadaceae bacterium]|nr:hypothetical protein [Fimbriimonadaceae bacterium]